MIDAGELDILCSSAINMGGDARVVDVIVNGCAYSCCGRGWQRRDGYEQRYRGWIDNLQPPGADGCATFMLYSPGIGTVSYVIAVRDFEVEAVNPG